MNFLTKSSLAVLLITLAAIVAEATPALGDRSVFDVTLAKGGQSLAGTVTFELTNYDSSKDAWTQVSTTDFNGQKQVSTESIDSQDLLDDATIDSVLANCPARGGKSESLNSPAGTFATCSVPVSNADGSGNVWVAKVPFGYAKWIANRKDGVVVTGILNNFQAGSKKMLR